MRAEPATVLEPRRSRIGQLLAGGPAGNERLTGTVAVMLLVLLAAEGVTILRIGQLFSPHVFIGLLLIPPLAVKLGSVGYRFTRYYAGNAAYRTKGPPQLGLRLVAPFVVATTVVVFASGVALIVAGPSSRSTLFPIHKLSFFAWLVVTAVHVLAYLPRVPLLARADFVDQARVARLAGRSGRWVVIASALALGVALAVLMLPLANGWPLHHHHHGG